MVMNRKEPRRKLVGPWRSIHGVIWLAGLYILITNHWIWPGILVLIVISAVYEGLLQRLAPEAYVEEIPPEASKPLEKIPTSSPAVMAPVLVVEHRLELLPPVCPNCNAPVHGHEVKWTGAQSASCAYCGTNLPMSKA